MSRSAAITLEWADGDYTFRLAWGELIQLQEAVDAGPLALLQRFSANTWRVQDISNILRLGLIGGGMAPVDALRKVRQYVEARPPMENVLFAQAVLSAALLGTPDETVKKNDGAESGSTTSPTESGGSEPSSAPALQ